MYRLGIDLGGTNIVAGVVNDNYEIGAKAQCKTAVPRPEAEICDSMAEVALAAIAEAGITLDDIEVGDVLSVMESHDGKKLTIEVCSEKVEGKIISYDEDSYEVEDAYGNLYELEVSENYIDALNRNLSVATELKLGGGTYLFSLDIAGKIAVPLMLEYSYEIYLDESATLTLPSTNDTSLPMNSLLPSIALKVLSFTASPILAVKCSSLVSSLPRPAEHTSR